MSADLFDMQNPDESPDQIWLKKHAVEVAANAWDTFLRKSQDRSVTFGKPSKIQILHQRRGGFVFRMCDVIKKDRFLFHDLIAHHTCLLHYKVKGVYLPEIK